MSDRVVDYGLRSLVRAIASGMIMLSGVRIVTTDFDWNNEPDPNAPNNLRPRPLPYAGVLLSSDSTPPFTVGNILYEQVIECQIYMLGRSYTQLTQLTADMKQVLKIAQNPITSGVGIVLYNFAVASGGFFANAGTLQVEIGRTEYFGPEQNSENDNRKYSSVTSVILSAYKDSQATLLESTGRLGFNDS